MKDQDRQGVIIKSILEGSPYYFDAVEFLPSISSSPPLLSLLVIPNEVKPHEANRHFEFSNESLVNYLPISELQYDSISANKNKKKWWVEKIILPISIALKNLNNLGLVYGCLNHNKLLFNNDNFHVILNENFTYPPWSRQLFPYMPPYMADCSDKFCRASCDIKDDLYSLGILCLYICAPNNKLFTLTGKFDIQEYLKSSDWDWNLVPKFLQGFVLGLINPSKESRLDLDSVINWCSGLKIALSKRSSQKESEQEELYPINYKGLVFYPSSFTFLLSQALVSGDDNRLNILLEFYNSYAEDNLLLKSDASQYAMLGDWSVRYSGFELLYRLLPHHECFKAGYLLAEWKKSHSNAGSYGLDKIEKFEDFIVCLDSLSMENSLNGDFEFTKSLMREPILMGYILANANDIYWENWFLISDFSNIDSFILSMAALERSLDHKSGEVKMMGFAKFLYESAKPIIFDEIKIKSIEKLCLDKLRLLANGEGDFYSLSKCESFQTLKNKSDIRYDEIMEEALEIETRLESICEQLSNSDSAYRSTNSATDAMDIHPPHHPTTATAYSTTLGSGEGFDAIGWPVKNSIMRRVKQNPAACCLSVFGLLILVVLYIMSGYHAFIIYLGSAFFVGASYYFFGVLLPKLLLLYDKYRCLRRLKILNRELS